MTATHHLLTLTPLSLPLNVPSSSLPSSVFFSSFIFFCPPPCSSLFFIGVALVCSSVLVLVISSEQGMVALWSVRVNYVWKRHTSHTRFRTPTAMPAARRFSFCNRSINNDCSILWLFLVGGLPLRDVWCSQGNDWFKGTIKDLQIGAVRLKWWRGKVLNSGVFNHFRHAVECVWLVSGVLVSASSGPSHAGYSGVGRGFQ